MEKYVISKTHLKNQKRFLLLKEICIKHAAISERQQIETQKHYERVDVNGQILAQIIRVVCYLRKQELAYRDHRANTES